MRKNGSVFEPKNLSECICIASKELAQISHKVRLTLQKMFLFASIFYLKALSLLKMFKYLS